MCANKQLNALWWYFLVLNLYSRPSAVWTVSDNPQSSEKHVFAQKVRWSTGPTSPSSTTRTLRLLCSSRSVRAASRAAILRAGAILGRQHLADGLGTQLYASCGEGCGNNFLRTAN